ncbi:hypothetical protein LTR41_009422 [Exophiala xenobiotica]|nr:hypothetical protein LTR41_009422 [Exophiala xenobiotica]
MAHKPHPNPARKQQYQLEDQANLLPKKQVIIVFSALACILLVTFIDQNSVGVMLTTIGGDLHAENTISWAATANLIANTTFQVLYGRLSDIFGRKGVLLTAILLLAVGDLGCGFAQSGPQLYALRGLSGVGSAGITALSMMVTSDIVTLRERGKYQGILGSCVGLGNIIGPFISAAFTEKATWRATFWFISPLAIVAGGIVLIVLPQKKPKDSFMSKIRKVDFIGSFFSTAGMILLLIPISGGGSYFDWRSVMVIVMIIFGALCMVAFVLVEWKVAQLPTMPLRLFKNRAVCAILAQNFLFGSVYYSILYYVPLALQNVRGLSPLASAGVIAAMVGAQSFTSVASGQYISRTGRYGEVLWFGYGVWTVGAALSCMFSRSLPIRAMAIFLFVEGIGVGNCFQPTLVASQAHCVKADRAVVISTRNFCRTFGAATGLAVCAAIFSNVLQSRLPPASALPDSFRQTVTASIFKTPDLTTLTQTQRDGVLNAYADASRAVFILWAPTMFVCFLSMVFVKDKGLERPDELSSSPPGQVVAVESGPEEVEKQGETREKERESSSQKAEADVGQGATTIGTDDARYNRREEV